MQFKYNNIYFTFKIKDCCNSNLDQNNSNSNQNKKNKLE